MERTAACMVLLFSLAGVANAETMRLTCSEYVVLAETAVQHRDSRIPKTDAKSYLAEDEFLTQVDKNLVKPVVGTVYASPAKGKQYIAAAARKDCARLSIKK